MGSNVSIVIIGRNEERGLAKCIEAAKAAAEQIGGCELIYVDSASTDSSVEIAASMGARVLSMRPEWKLCPSAGRYIGSQFANGDYILFLDADTLLYKDFMAEALMYFDADTKIAGVNGRIDDLDEKGDMLSDIEDRYRDTVDVKWLRGPACFYRKSSLLEVGSFDPNLAVEEEAELGLRLVSNGWRLALIPIPMACHTRCFHCQTLSSLISIFRRDIVSGRLGELMRTISVAARNGNGIAFIKLRLKTTILFALWCALMIAAAMLPSGFGSVWIMLTMLVGGFVLLAVRKKSAKQALLFVPNKVLYIVDLIAGLPKISITEGRRYPINIIEQEAR